MRFVRWEGAWAGRWRRGKHWVPSGVHDGGWVGTAGRRMARAGLRTAADGARTAIARARTATAVGRLRGAGPRTATAVGRMPPPNERAPRDPGARRRCVLQERFTGGRPGEECRPPAPCPLEEARGGSRPGRWPLHFALPAPSHAAPLLRDESAGGGVRYPYDPGAAGASGGEHDGDLHARAEPRRAGGAEPARRGAGAPAVRGGDRDGVRGLGGAGGGA